MPYNFRDAFKTPSKSKPAEVIRTNRSIIDERDKLEESMVDEQVGVTDEEVDYTHLYSPKVVPSSRTPSYARRKSSLEFQEEGHRATVNELSKLVAYLSSRNASRESAKRYLLIFVTVLSVLVALYSVRPFCGSVLGRVMPCVPCPPHAKCNTFTIASCDENYTKMGNSLCVRSGLLGDTSHQIALQLKSILEYYAWQHDCAGKTDSKLVELSDHIDTLYHVFERYNASDDHSFSHSLKESKELLVQNPNIFRSAVNQQGLYYSYHFEGKLSCLNPVVVKYALQYYLHALKMHLRDMYNRGRQAALVNEADNAQKVQVAEQVATEQVGVVEKVQVLEVEQIVEVPEEQTEELVRTTTSTTTTATEEVSVNNE